VRPWPHHPSGHLDIPCFYGRISHFVEKSNFLSVIMTTNKKETAAEFIAHLHSDPEWVRQNEMRDDQLKAAIEKHKAILSETIKELNEAGYPVDSIDELRESGIPYKTAIPILLKWLPQITSETGAKESIVRALSVPWAKPAALFPLFAEYRSASKQEEGLKWAIGNALEVIVDDSVFNEIAELVKNKDHGKSREMLVLALGKIKNPNAIDLLIELLNDDEVVGHALIALGKLKAIKALPYIKKMTTHSKLWVRKQAIKSINKIEGEEIQKHNNNN
jgi:hypothetical protein